MSIVSLKCPVCKNYEFDTFKDVFDDRFGEPNQYKLAKCTRCNHISTFPRLKEQTLENYTNNIIQENILITNKYLKKQIKILVHYQIFFIGLKV